PAGEKLRLFQPDSRNCLKGRRGRGDVTPLLRRPFGPFCPFRLFRSKFLKNFLPGDLLSRTLGPMVGMARRTRTQRSLGKELTQPNVILDNGKPVVRRGRKAMGS